MISLLEFYQLLIKLLFLYRVDVRLTVDCLLERAYLVGLFQLSPSLAYLQHFGLEGFITLLLLG